MLYDLAGELMYTDKLPPPAGTAPASAGTAANSAPQSTSTQAATPAVQIPTSVPQAECDYTNNLDLTNAPQGEQPGTTTQPGPQLNTSFVTFTWCSKPTDSSYYLQVLRRDGSGVVEVGRTLTTPYYTQALHDGVAYLWRVQSCTIYNQCLWSSYYNFSTPVGGWGIPITPTAANPGNAAAPGPTVGDKNITLSWYVSSDVQWVHIVIQNQTSGATVVDTDTSPTSSTTSYQASLSYSTGYVWTVQACNYNGCSDPTAPLYFQTSAPAVETQTDYLKLGGDVVAQTALASGVTTVTYLHDDLLGSPRLATNASKSVLWHEHFDPYGQKMTGASEKIGYTGHAYDAESQLTYMQARFYDAEVGRFLSSDPLAFSPSDPFTFGRYGYANESPYVHTDPTGMEDVPRPPDSDERTPPTGTHLSRTGATLGANGQLTFSSEVMVASIEVKGSKTFKSKVDGDISDIKSKPGGKALVDKLEATPNVITIKEDTQGNGNSTTPSGGPSANGKGNGSTIVFDPNKTDGGKDATGSNQRPPYVGLGHELGHARAIDLGVQSFNYGSGRPGTTPPAEIHSLSNENMIRQEHNLPIRPSYYDK